MNLESGASGTVSKVVRMPGLDGVDEADRGDVDLAVEVGDDVGQRVAAVGAQVDRAFQRLVEQRA